MYDWNEYLNTTQESPWFTDYPRVGNVVAWLLQQGWSLSDTVYQDETPLTIQQVMEQTEPQVEIAEFYDNQDGLLDGSKGVGWYTL